MFSFRSNKNTGFEWPVKLDLHSHEIPGLDDGAPTVDFSIELLKGKIELGFTHCICTPHVNSYFPNTKENILNAFDELQKAIEKEQLPIKIKPSGEFMLDDHFMSLQSNGEHLLPLHEKVLLTEFDWSAPPVNLKEISFSLFTEGYRLLLAHPERYNYLSNNYDKLIQLHDHGFKFQLNILSLTGQYGQDTLKTAKWLLKENLYDYLGTDMHHAGHLQALQSSSNQKAFRQLIGDYNFKNDELIW